MAEQGFHFANLHTVIDPAFDLADPVNISIVEETMASVRSLRFE